MLYFKDFLNKKGFTIEDLFKPSYNPHKEIEGAIAVISNFEPSEIEDCKPLLLELQKLLEKVLSGGD